MSDYAVPTMLIVVALLLLGSLLVVLRTPLRLLDLRVRTQEVELRLQALEEAHKKAVRKWGADLKRLQPSTTTEEEGASDEADAAPFLPNLGPAADGGHSEDPLLQIRRLYREKFKRG